MPRESVRMARTTHHMITAPAMSPRAISSSVPCSGQTWRRSTATQTTTARPERFHARAVRSPASPASGSPTGALTGAQWLPTGGDHNGDRPDGHDADGENQGHPRTRQGLTPPHGLLVGAPLAQALRRHDRAQGDQRQPQEAPTPFHLELGQELRRRDPGGDQGQGRSVPGQEGPLVGVREPHVGLVVVLRRAAVRERRARDRHPRLARQCPAPAQATGVSHAGPSLARVPHPVHPKQYPAQRNILGLFRNEPGPGQPFGRCPCADESAGGTL